jgi:aminoglycoside phosphotransferase (APT) family kinase protein
MSVNAAIPPEVSPVRPGEELDWPSLEAYLRENIPELSGDFSVLQFPNGAANLTYFVQIGDRALVVRRPPFGVIAPGAHDMRREYRTLSVLWQHFDRAPRGYLFCDDHSVIGADFLVIEYRPGVVIWGAIPPSMEHHADAARRVGFAVIDALAELHTLDPVACGLADLGKPDGFVTRQVTGWRKRWDLAALPDSEPLMASVGDRLLASIPESHRPSILHNDFKLDNCQFDPANPDRVKSIFDWDMATIGDPFIDLGTTLNYWPDPGDVAEEPQLLSSGVASLGLPRRSEIIERYSATTGLDVGDVRWYEAFACWKTAVVLQQLFVRWARGESTDNRMATRGPLVSVQARRAARLLDDAGL